MPTKSVKLSDLKSATEASIKAILGQNFPGKPGVLVGLWIDKATIDKLELKPENIAKQVTKQVSVASGIKVKAGLKPAGGGILVGSVMSSLRS